MYVQARAGFPGCEEHHDNIGFGNLKENTNEICEEYEFSTRFTWISLYRVRHRVLIEQNMCIVLKVQE